jgi:formylglycine-generating enzyme required for sulfatase activity
MKYFNSLKIYTTIFIIVSSSYCGANIFVNANDTTKIIPFEKYTETIKDKIVHFNMIPISGGIFSIGSQDGDKDEMPIKKVEVSDFYFGETEVVYDLWQLFIDESEDPSPVSDAISRPSPPYIDFTLGMGKSGGYPANSMQQYSALMFCQWLFEKTGRFYRIPTELEWEYVAKKAYPDFDIKDKKLSEQEWFSINTEVYQKSASKKPNSLGIYDLLGNVSEWTLDQYDETYFTKIVEGSKDPISEKTKRYPSTVKGGNYASPIADLRPSNRTKSDPIWNRRDPQIPKSKWWNADSPFVGMRLISPRTQPSTEEIKTFFTNILK